MNDRELLELAAKAAKRDVLWKRGTWGGEPYEGLWDRTTSIPTNWNPLADDGDALRLAVKLRMDLTIGDSATHAICQIHLGSQACWDDNYAATRRAIVRAAAEIGRSMP